MSQAQTRLVSLYEDYALKLSLSKDVINKAISIYNEAKKHGCIRGYSTEEIAAGTFFVASVLLSKDVSIRDVASVSATNERLIWSVAKTLQRKGLVSRIAPQRNMTNILRRKLAGKLDQEDLNKLSYMMNRSFDNIKKLAGHVSPRAVLGAVVWLASKRRTIKMKMTQRELSKLFNVNEVSLREAAKRIKPSFFI